MARIIKEPTQDLLLNVLATLPQNPRRRLISFSHKKNPEESYLSLIFDNNLQDFKISSLEQSLSQFMQHVPIQNLNFYINSPKAFGIFRKNYLYSFVDDYKLEYFQLEIINPSYPQYKSSINFDENSGLQVGFPELDCDAEKLKAWLDNLK